MKWEYLVTALEPDRQKLRGLQLNDLGDERWELVTVIREADKFLGYFKREHKP